MKRLLLAAALFCCTLSASGLLRAYGEENELRWYKGNTHTHTVNSDGDSSPDVAVRWYREHGYNFVVITDHNFATDVRGLNALFAAGGEFLVIPGEEVTDKFEAEGRYAAVHVNALNLGRTIPPAGGGSVAGTLQRNVDAVSAAEALCHLNHPNFHWSYTVGELDSVKGYHLFEVANFSSECNDYGGGGYPGTEALWDSLLTRGRRMYGVASDDAHNYRDFGPEFDNPGRGWVMVRCAALTADQIISALDRGEFYSSSGVVLDDIRFDGKSLTVRMKEERNLKYTVRFIGRQGKTLAVSYDNPAVYSVKGDEGYVRARVVDSNGKIAWVQPFWPE